jgi:hypothetical protein
VVHLNKNDKMVHMKKILGILLVVLVSALSISGVIFNATEVSVNANPETTVGGILGENTTWTLENSPYIITDTVQIPENIVLTIEPGVVIESALNSSEDYMFVLHGKIVARGTVDNKIVFDGGCTATGFSQDPESYGSSFFTTGGAPSDPQVILDHCVIQNGNRFYWGTRGHLNLTNSELTNLGLTFWGYNGDSQIYSSGQDVYIQNNLFINTTGFGIAHLDANVFMRYNLFTENRGPLVRSTQGLESRTFINYNSFIEVSETVLRLSSSGTDVILDATNNYWGTIDTSMIDSWIFDGNDDINIRGVIEYSPILTEPHPDTPTSYVYTELSGILSSDTTWTKENSPYIISETVQIPEDVVLTIEAGVTVVFEGTGDMFLVGGGICAQGTASEKITFEGGGTTNFFNVILSDNSSLQLEHCILRNGDKIWSIANGVTQVILRHSMLVDIASYSTLYHWREACYIEYNTFVDSAGITLYNWFGEDSEATVYIRYNLVKGNSGFFVRCSPNVHNQEIVVKYNSFIDVDGIFLALHSGLGDYVAVTATENYWGTTNTTIIDSLIYDKNDNITLPNVIEYMPILTEPHPDTPTLHTEVGGILASDTTWTLENSPYLVTEDVVVDSGVILTIEAGVTVEFTSDTNLIIDGGLTAQGNSTHPIIFTSRSLTPAPGDWGTIKFRWRSNNSSVVNWAIISYATDGITVESSFPTIQNSMITQNILGIRVDYTMELVFGKPTIDNCTISDNLGQENPYEEHGRAGGIFIDAGEVDVKDSLIENNIGCGITTTGAYNRISVNGSIVSNNEGHGVFGEYLTINNCSIRNNNGNGLDSWVSVNVSDSVIANNIGNGVCGGWEAVIIVRSIIDNNGGVGVYGFETANHEITGHVEIFDSEIKANLNSGILSSGGEVHYNNLLNNTPFDYENIGTFDVNATHNWWGITNKATIDEHIVDYYDDYNLGKVLYEPYLVPPVARFIYSPSTPYKHQTLRFDASESSNLYGSITAYEWEFGDGNKTVTSSPLVTHVYETKGTYNVNLTVTDEFGLTNSKITPLTIIEDNMSPITVDNYNEEWHSEDFTIVLTPTDHESGVAETYYKINNGTTKTVGADGQPLITTEGADNTLEYWSVDNAGNEEPSNLLTGIKLDKTPPTVEKLSHLPERDELLEQTVTVSVKVTDLYSGVKNVTLSYNLNDETAWNDIVMTLNSTTGLYECIIPEQEENARVKYTITTYDNAENHDTEDNHGQYFVYTAVPEFPSWIILPLILAATLFITFCRRKLTKTPRQQHI